jgi:hypothetical protein
VLNLQCQQGTRAPYEIFEFANDMHDTSLRTATMKGTSARSTLRNADIRARTDGDRPSWHQCLPNGCCYRPAWRLAWADLIWRNQS